MRIASPGLTSLPYGSSRKNSDSRDAFGRHSETELLSSPLKYSDCFTVVFIGALNIALILWLAKPVCQILLLNYLLSPSTFAVAAFFGRFIRRPTDITGPESK